MIKKIDFPDLKTGDIGNVMNDHFISKGISFFQRLFRNKYYMYNHTFIMMDSHKHNPNRYTILEATFEK